MFRHDKLIVTRENYSLVSGEKVYNTPEIIGYDIPCHLSVNLNNTSQINGAPHVISDFKLFLDASLDIDIKENDKLIVQSADNKIYELYAGEIKTYNLTTQVRCRQEKIVESST